MNREAQYYVYRNLHKGGYSVRIKGKVLYVARDLWLQCVTFQVSDAGRQRVLRERRKNVHAYCVTRFLPVIADNALTKKQMEHVASFYPDPPVRLYYNPHECGHFYTHGFPGTIVERAALVHLSPDGVFGYVTQGAPA